MRKLQKNKATCSTIRNYVVEKEGALDDKGQKELATIADKLDKYETGLIAMIDAESGAKTRHVLAHKNLMNAIHVSRNALEIVRLAGGGVKVLGGDLRDGRHAAKIHDVAIGYQKALEAAGNDPVIKVSITGLAAAMDAYAKASAELKTQRQGLSGIRRESGSEMNEMAVRLAGFARFITSNIPRNERNDLIRRIRAVTGGVTHATRQTDAATTTVISTPVETVEKKEVVADGSMVTPSGRRDIADKAA